MNTQGLKGIWGLEQLDNTGASSWKLVSVFTVSGVLIGAALSVLIGPVHADSLMASFYTPVVSTVTLLGVCGVIGFSTALNVVIARAIEADLSVLSLVDDVRECIPLLRPAPKVLLSIILPMLLVAVLTGPTLAGGRLGLPLGEAFVVYFGAGPLTKLLVLLLLPLMSLAWGIGMAIGVGQIRCLIRLARTIRVEFLQMDRYCALANPAIRVILIAVSIVSLFPIMMLYVDDAVFSTQVAKMVLMMLVSAVPLIVMWSCPVLILRNRIRDRKAQELHNIMLALQGQDVTLTLARPQNPDTPLSTADLLTHQMFIESRWEWPVAAHVQKLILFGLLPPTTWVLSAGIENFMF